MPITKHANTNLGWFHGSCSQSPQPLLEPLLPFHHKTREEFFQTISPRIAPPPNRQTRPKARNDNPQAARPQSPNHTDIDLLRNQQRSQDHEQTDNHPSTTSSPS